MHLQKHVCGECWKKRQISLNLCCTPSVHRSQRQSLTLLKYYLIKCKQTKTVLIIQTFHWNTATSNSDEKRTLSPSPQQRDEGEEGGESPLFHVPFPTWNLHHPVLPPPARSLSHLIHEPCNTYHLDSNPSPFLQLHCILSCVSC